MISAVNATDMSSNISLDSSNNVLDDNCYPEETISFSENDSFSDELSTKDVSDYISLDETEEGNVSSDDGVVSFDNLDDWTTEGSVSVSSDGYDGSCVALSDGGKISKAVNWSNVEKVSFWYKVSAMTGFFATIGGDANQVLGNIFMSDSDWTFVEYNTSSLSDSLNLEFTTTMGTAYVDSLVFTFKSIEENITNNSTTENNTNENSTSNNNTNTNTTGNNTNVSSNDNNLIINPDFEDVNQTGWTLSKTVYVSYKSYSGKYSVYTSVSGYLSQEINFDSIDSLNYWINPIDNHLVLMSYLDDILINSQGDFTGDEWQNVILNVRNITGNHVLKIVTTYSRAYIDNFSIKFIENATSGNTTGGNITDGNATSGNNTNVTDNNSTTNDTVVTKMVTKLSATNVNMVYNGGKSVIITLKDSNGNILTNKKITITINGKLYSRTTNSKGQTSISVNLKPKTYVATIKFAGDDTYNGSSTKSTIKITKATPKLTAKKKTFKVKTKTKKYSITLKTNKNKVLKNTKVTLKVKGKVYKAKTNKKGIATFKITKLTKKGTFKAVIKFAGSSYYKSLSKTVKIVIKK